MEAENAVRYAEVADLADSELRARLIQHGVPEHRAARLVNDRDHSLEARAEIAEVLS